MIAATQIRSARTTCLRDFAPSWPIAVILLGVFAAAGTPSLFVALIGYFSSRCGTFFGSVYLRRGRS